MLFLVRRPSNQQRVDYLHPKGKETGFFSFFLRTKMDLGIVEDLILLIMLRLKLMTQDMKKTLRPLKMTKKRKNEAGLANHPTLEVTQQIVRSSDSQGIWHMKQMMEGQKHMWKVVMMVGN